MLGLDEALQERWRREKLREESNSRRQSSLLQELKSHMVVVASDAGHDVTNLQEQLGNPLHITEVMRRLKLCCPNLHFERANVDQSLWGAYLIVSDDLGIRKQHLWTLGTDGVMPEFTVIHTKTVRVPDPDFVGKVMTDPNQGWLNQETYRDQTNGWRTALTRLLKAKIITDGDVAKHFPLPSRESRKWAEQTQ